MTIELLEDMDSLFTPNRTWRKGLWVSNLADSVAKQLIDEGKAIFVSNSNTGIDTGTNYKLNTTEGDEPTAISGNNITPLVSLEIEDNISSKEVKRVK